MHSTRCRYSIPLYTFHNIVNLIKVSYNVRQSSIFIKWSIVFFMHSFIHFFMHSFIHCISVWVGSTWFDPPPHPFQIGRGPLGTAASSLPTFPSSLSWSWDERSQRVKYWSPAPIPPTRLEGSHHGMVELSFLLTTPPIHHPVSFTVLCCGCCFQFYQCPACMHAPQCLCFSSALRNYFLPACSPKGGLLLWLLAPSQVVVVVTSLRCAAESSMKDETPRCLLAVALTSKPHLSHQDFFASTNRISCSVRHDTTEASLCVFSSSSASSAPAAKWPPSDGDFGNAISPEMHGSDSWFCVTCASVVGRIALDCSWLVFQQGCSLEGRSTVLENDYDATPDHSELEEAWWDKGKLCFSSFVSVTPRIAQNLRAKPIVIKSQSWTYLKFQKPHEVVFQTYPFGLHNIRKTCEMKYCRCVLW